MRAAARPTARLPIGPQPTPNVQTPIAAPRSLSSVERCINDWDSESLTAAMAPTTKIGTRATCEGRREGEDHQRAPKTPLAVSRTLPRVSRVP